VHHRIIFAVLGLLAIVWPAAAGTRTWTGASSAVWSDPGNWGGVAPASGDDLVFPAGAANQANTNDLAGMGFNSIGYTGGAYTSDGNPIGIGSGGLAVSGGSQTFSIDTTLNASQTWSITAPATVNGAIDLNGRTLTIDNSATVVLAGAISGSLLNGSGILQYGLVLTGSGLLHLGGANTFRATVGARGGRLIADGDGAIPPDTQLSVDASATFDLAGHTITLDDLTGIGNVALSGGSLIRDGRNTSSTGATGHSFSGPGTITVRGSRLAEFGDAKSGSDVALFVEDEVSISPVYNHTVAFDANITLTGARSKLWLRNGAHVGLLTVNSGQLIIGASPYFGQPESAEASARDLTMGSGATFIAGSEYPVYRRGVLHVNGTVSLGSAALLVSDYDFGKYLYPKTALLPAARNAAPITIIDNDGADAVGGTFAGLPEGAISEKTWRVSYQGGDGNDVTVTSVPTATIALTSSKNPSIVGDTVTFTATVTPPAGGPVPAGTVTFASTYQYAGAFNVVVPLDGLGMASYSTSALGVGDSFGVLATYSGDATYPITSISMIQRVSAPPPRVTNVTLSSSSNPSQPGQPVTLTASVVPAGQGPVPTGTVTFFEYDGSGTLPGRFVMDVTLDSSGAATVTIPDLPPGGQLFTAYYQGDANDYAATSTEFLQQVGDVASAKIVFTSSPNPSPLGEPITVTAQVTTPDGATPLPGRVLFHGGTLGRYADLDGNGVATYTTNQFEVFPAGVYHLSALFLGSPGAAIAYVDQQVSSTSQTLTLTTLSSSQNPSAEGASVALKAVVATLNGSPPPTGTVTFFDGSMTLQTVSLDVTHVAMYTTAALSAGVHSITAYYGGDATHAPSTSAALMQTVSALLMTSTTSLVTSKNPSFNGEAVMLVVAVEGPPGVAMPTGSVALIANGIQFATLTLDSTGHATMSHPFPSGTYMILAIYSGDDNYSVSSAVILQSVAGYERRRAVRTQ